MERLPEMWEHHFRKTSLQLARRGDDRSQRLVAGASLTATVVEASCVLGDDEDFPTSGVGITDRGFGSLRVRGKSDGSSY